jgi:hypothetical protein
VGTDNRRTKTGKLPEDFFDYLAFFKCGIIFFKYLPACGKTFAMNRRNISGALLEAAIEVKFSHTIAERGIKNLARRRDLLGDNFVRGAVIYSGHEIIPLGDRLIALPAGALFR